MKILTTTILFLAANCLLVAQSEKADSSKFQVPVTFTDQEDHDNMMQQLGITVLRPGTSLCIKDFFVEISYISLIYFLISPRI